MKYLLLFSFFLLLSCRRDITGIDNDNLWQFSSPEAQGLNSKILNKAFDEAEQSGFMDCLLIIKNRHIVAEKYYNVYNKSKAHNVKSVSKSFLSAITGIALREGYIENLDLKMLSFFPEYDSPLLDARKKDITIRHLLMMRAGLQHERYNYSQLYGSENWIKSTIEFPLTYDPGSTFSYNTFETHLLSAILTKSSGMSTKDLMEKYLLNPMKISLDNWELGPNGYYFGGNSMEFSPRDMAVLGYLYLHNGFMNGKQIVPADWVEKSLTNYTGFSDNEWGYLKSVNYGYLWWLGEMEGYQTFQAVGYGGQFVMCFPGLDMIIVTTAKTKINWDKSDQQIGHILSIIANNIMQAIRK